MREWLAVKKLVSYDIACQWSKNLWARLRKYPSSFSHLSNSITFLIPKFHLPAHREYCRAYYSFNLSVHVGRTDGEAVERGWAFVNAFAGSTKEMGPGSRRDKLDDVFGDYNWRKVTQLRKYPGFVMTTTDTDLSRENTTRQGQECSPGAQHAIGAV